MNWLNRIWCHLFHDNEWELDERTPIVLGRPFFYCHVCKQARVL